MSKEELNVFIIPPNFTDGIVIAGKDISLRCFLQALITAAIPTAIVFILYEPGSLITRVSVCISVFLPVFVFSAAGIWGNGVLDFLIIMLRFFRKKRRCFYNPRIKQENQPVSPLSRSGRVIATSRISDLLRKTSGRNAEHTDETLFFAEDAGICETPVEYMNLIQYLRYLRKKERKKKEVRVYED